MKKCFFCGATIKEDVKVCPRCGKSTSLADKLLNQAMAGDSVARSELYDSTHDAVFEQIRAKVSNDEIANEILEETYQQAFEKLDHLRYTNAFSSWLLAIAQNQTAKWYQLHSEENEEVEQPKPEEESTDTPVIDDDVSLPDEKENNEDLQNQDSDQTLSFTKYVELRFFNDLCQAAKDYVDGNRDQLGLRLKKVKKIGSVEWVDASIVRVYVQDLPGTRIAFNVNMKLDLYVKDNKPSNQNVDECRPWIRISCEGDLSCGLDDWKIVKIEPYSRVSIPNNSMTDVLVPMIANDQMEQVATEFLKDYYPEALKTTPAGVPPVSVDPTALAEKLGLTILEHGISKDGDIFGQIYFEDTFAELYDADADKSLPIYLSAGTIVVDPSNFLLYNLGSVNNTIVHECVHWIKHRKYFELEKLFNPRKANITCKVEGSGESGIASSAVNQMEYQANRLAPRIQMPAEPFTAKANEYIDQLKREHNTEDVIDVIEPAIAKLADNFGVSKQAAKIRMVDLGFNEATGAYVYVDGKHIQPHKTSTVALQTNETFSIPVSEMARETMSNVQLREQVDSGVYLFVDNHLVINSKKYVERGERGKLLLTRYARNHMEECCLLFQVSTNSRIGRSYSLEYFLNNTKKGNEKKASQLSYRVVFKEDDSEKDAWKYTKKENEENEKQKRDKSIKGYIKDIFDVFHKLPNSFSGSLDKLINWRGMTEEDLAEASEVSEKTIQRLRRNEPNGVKMETVIQLCIGLNLDPILSKALLNAAGKKLMQTELHIMYHFLLTTYYENTVLDWDEILYAQGLPLLGKESKEYFTNSSTRRH